MRNYQWKPWKGLSQLAKELNLPDYINIEVRQAKSSGKPTFRLLIGEREELANKPIGVIRRELNGFNHKKHKPPALSKAPKRRTVRSGSGRKRIL